VKSKIFVSCGQRSPEERDVAGKLQSLLIARGFDVYVAINAQTILEINAGIINELKNSDSYLFINFRRDQIGTEYSGSLFSNQELAIAYALGFERILVINQNGLRREGMLGYIGINTETFDRLDDCCAIVERALDRAAGHLPMFGDCMQMVFGSQTSQSSMDSSWYGSSTSIFSTADPTLLRSKRPRDFVIAGRTEGPPCLPPYVVH
jgi:hypothetical protein